MQTQFTPELEILLESKIQELLSNDPKNTLSIIMYQCEIWLGRSLRQDREEVLKLALEHQIIPC